MIAFAGHIATAVHEIADMQLLGDFSTTGVNQETFQLLAALCEKEHEVV